MVNSHSGAQAEFVAQLLELSVDPTVKDKNGETALKLAKKDGNDEIVRQLEAASRRPN